MHAPTLRSPVRSPSGRELTTGIRGIYLLYNRAEIQRTKERTYARGTGGTRRVYVCMCICILMHIHRIHAHLYIYTIYVHTKVACSERAPAEREKSSFMPSEQSGLRIARSSSSALGCSGTSRPKNQPVRSTSPTHSDRLSLSYPGEPLFRTGLRNIYLLARPFASLARLAPKREAFAESHRFKHAASLKRRVRIGTGSTWNRSNTNCFKSTCQFSFEYRKVNSENARYSKNLDVLVRSLNDTCSIVESIPNLDQSGRGPIRPVSNQYCTCFIFLYEKISNMLL